MLRQLQNVCVTYMVNDAECQGTVFPMYDLVPNVTESFKGTSRQCTTGTECYLSKTGYSHVEQSVTHVGQSILHVGQSVSWLAMW